MEKVAKLGSSLRCQFGCPGLDASFFHGTKSGRLDGKVTNVILNDLMGNAET